MKKQLLSAAIAALLSSPALADTCQSPTAYTFGTPDCYQIDLAPYGKRISTLLSWFRGNFHPTYPTPNSWGTAPAATTTSAGRGPDIGIGFGVETPDNPMALGEVPGTGRPGATVGPTKADDGPGSTSPGDSPDVR